MPKGRSPGQKAERPKGQKTKGAKPLRKQAGTEWCWRHKISAADAATFSAASDENEPRQRPGVGRTAVGAKPLNKQQVDFAKLISIAAMGEQPARC